jgi:phosphoribosylformylglycinamidine synthase
MDTRKKLSDFNPMEQEILKIYWSDHCRHTTFNTHITDIKIQDGDKQFKSVVQKSLADYKQQREQVHGERMKQKPITLMDLATISAKYEKSRGGLENHVNDKIEFNACTISTDINGKQYRLSFKNETHNSPTEKYPFDGAATALGGTIRDIMASRAVPYQGIRVSGSADPVNTQTMDGKLAQREITTQAAQGFSSYARAVNATVGQVMEIYHPGYVAKRMEGGLVAGYVASESARVEELVPGDIVVLIGLKTGRDGIGAAADSSTTQDKVVISACPIGYPEVGGKLIKLYSDPKFLQLVQKCNDFGAGGVSVAVGELADSLDIYLERVPTSVDGLTPTEIAISETQERMAVGIAKCDIDKLLKLTNKYGLEATVVADVTDTGYMSMFYKGERVVHMSRAFLDTAGDTREQKIVIEKPKGENALKGKQYTNFADMVLGIMGDLQSCSQQGIAEYFVQTNEYTVLSPFDGKREKSPTQGSVMLVPVKGNKNRVTIATAGFDPYISSWSPYYGGIAARLDSIAKVLALGGDYRDIYHTDQEYYGTCSTPEKFGLPFAALLGANEVARTMGTAAIGGKDSMSGSYKDIDVPPTLISYAFAPADIKTVAPQLFTKAGSTVGLIEVNQDNLVEARAKWDYFVEQRNAGNIIMSRAIGAGGVIAEICNAGLGNDIGFKFNDEIKMSDLSNKIYGSLLVEIKDGVELDSSIVKILGTTAAEKTIQLGNEKVCLMQVLNTSEARLAPVFPIKN